MHTSCVRKGEEAAGAALSVQAAPGGAVGYGGQCKKNAPEFQELGARRAVESLEQFLCVSVSVFVLAAARRAPTSLSRHTR